MTYTRPQGGESEKPAVRGFLKLTGINHLRKLYSKELNEQTSLSLVSSCSSKIEDLDSHTVEGINDWSNQRVKELHKQVLSEEEFLDWLSVVCSQKNNEDTVEEGEDTKKGSVILDQDISDQVKPQYHVTQQQVLGNCNSKPEVKLPETKLDPRIAYFVSLIFKASGIETGGNIMDSPLKLHHKLEMEEYRVLSLYKSLHCELMPIEVNSKEFHMIKKYMKNTHAEKHRNYTAEIVQIFTASRHGEADSFSEFSNTKNRMLLWHGSPLPNWVGILTEGLRIAPPQAPKTGYMFGKGVYFADMFSKSANYCHASQHASHGVLLLCEVALGEMAELRRANHDADKLPEGKLSTKGVGATTPDMLMIETLEDGVVVPLGHPKKQLESNQTKLKYNEYVVYNVNQIRMRYVVHVNVTYKAKGVQLNRKQRVTM